MTILLAVIVCGLVSIVYALWAIRSVMVADQGTPRMKEIAGFIREGAQAYLTRQYTTIAIVGVVVFVLAWLLLSLTAAIGFLRQSMSRPSCLDQLHCLPILRPPNESWQS